ncbi:enhancer of mRNA-decapping protein 4 homolog [Condylostylus longicornis]|uniref:enhancer of mRNA-decapping protein 4 homolog n=1 Tax=Condylostylus longicornis TaxID=2530218 RepID=UPI00244E3D97|nr:enhancer of mRNA-decapping protein 4 homolog [Condylostylus longicornis]
MSNYMDSKTANASGSSPQQQNIISFKSNVTNKITKKIIGKDVKIICSNTGSELEHGSSKVRLKNIVDYTWEEKRYPGHLIAVHMDGKHIAYVIKVSNRQTGAEEGMVRVVNTTTSKRALIKGMASEVLDVQFAHIERTQVLACIDSSNLYVHKIDMLSDNLICSLLLRVEDPLENYQAKVNKISWCPLFPIRDDEFSSNSNDEDDQDSSQLIVWSRGKVFQCFNVNIIINSHGIGKHNPKDISDGYLQSKDNNTIITWISLSPDGTTLSVGSEDGYIRFYQVYFHEKQPRCLHEWNPHNGQSISSFFFLDNYRKKSSTDTFWKHALTGAKNNTELKLWDCGTWECLQTLSFTYPIPNKKSPSALYFNADIDSSSSYLVLSNIESRNLYILQIGFDNNINDQKVKSSDNRIKKLNNSVNIRGISEYPISWPILSFSIVDTNITQLYTYNMNESYLMDDVDEYDEDNLAISGVVLRLFVVQPKSVQECLIFYQPLSEFDENDNCDLNSTSSENNESVLLADLLDEPLDYAKALKTGETNLSSSINESSTGASTIKKSIEEVDIKKKLNCSSPLIQGLSNFDKSQEEEKMAVAAATVPSGQSQKSSQISLMTPESFSAKLTSTNTSKDNSKKSPELVNSDVLSTILMLASVTGSQSTKAQTENLNFLNLVNNKIIEDQQKLRTQGNASGMPIIPSSIEEKPNNAVVDFGMEDIDNEEEDDEDDDDSLTGKNNSSLTSGGSSPPSREVQEIMSSKDYETKLLSHFVYKIENANKETKEKVNKFQTASEIAAGVINASVSSEKTQQQPISKNSSTSSNKVCNNDGVDSNKKKLSATDWPKVPDLKTVGGPTEILPSTPNSIPLPSLAQPMQPQQQQSILNSSPQVKSNTNVLSSTPPSTQVINRMDITELNSKIDTLIQVLQLQSTQIKNLEKEVIELRIKNESSIKVNNTSIQDLSRQTENQIIKILEDYLTKFDKEYCRKYEEFLFETEKHCRVLEEKWNVKNQVFFNQIVEKFSNTIVPVLLKRLDAIQTQMQAEVVKKLSTLEQALRETITHLCRSKPIIDTFGKSVLMGVQGSLQAAFIESMSSTLIPAYEKSSQNMFRQLHETFSIGIKEVMEQFDNYLSQMQPVQETTDQILNRIGKLREVLHGNLSRQTQSINDNLLETKKEIKQLEINFIRHFSELIKKEIQRNFETQVASLEDSVLSAVRSQAATPAPSSLYELQDQIKQLLTQNQVNSAFNQALLANDLSLVEYTLEKADYKAVFTSQGCCLEQTVLLSLIQQVSADMSNHNELKQKYLAEAILNLNLSDPITKEHAPKVMKELYRNCQNYLSTNSKSPLCSNVRMIMMAVLGMGYKFN